MDPLRLDSHDFNYGFMISLNQGSYHIKESNSLPDTVNVKVKDEPGFNIGIISLVRLNKNVWFRFNPGLSFEERRLLYGINNKSNLASVGFQRVESTNLSLPVHLKIATRRIENVRPFILCGGFYTIDMRSSKVALQNKITCETDLGYGLGFGCDFYLEYFKFGLELKYNEGTKNILLQQNNFVTAPLESIKTRSFVFSLTFEG